ncbi:MAG: LamG domain-containing protein [Candidatus Anammoximicrobium sp.]|nr:LamG domain-containing protein [Candidatus Anammoximicrobium sp.]
MSPMTSATCRAGLLVCTLLALVRAGIAQDSPSPLGRGGDNTALARFGNAVVFYLSFDRHELAEITAGSPEPQRDRWAEFLKARPDPYISGVFGHSLLSGPYTLSYVSLARTRLGACGAVALWLRGQTLHHRGEYYWPIRLHVAGSHSLMFGRMGDPRNDEKLYAYLQHGAHHATAVMGSMADWQPDAWHLVVVNWDRTGVELSLDGQSPVRSALREPLPAADPGEFRVTVNSPTDETIAMDELLILSVPLASADIAWLQQAHASLDKPPAGRVRIRPRSFRQTGSS